VSEEIPAGYGVWIQKERNSDKVGEQKY